MFRKLFENKKRHYSNDRFKSLVHILSSMNEQELEKVEKLLNLVFDKENPSEIEPMTDGENYSTEAPPLKEESLEDRIDKAKAQLKTDELEKRIEEFKKGRK